MKFFRAIFLGIKNDLEFRILLFLLFSLLLGSTLFYNNVEGWSVVDSLYFSVMTMSTVGFGDFVPSTSLSKVFTIIFTFLSIGVFVAIITKIVTLTVSQNHKILKRIKSKTLTKNNDKENDKE